MVKRERAKKNYLVYTLRALTNRKSKQWIGLLLRECECVCMRFDYYPKAVSFYLYYILIIILIQCEMKMGNWKKINMCARPRVTVWVNEREREGKGKLPAYGQGVLMIRKPNKTEMMRKMKQKKREESLCSVTLEWNKIKLGSNIIFGTRPILI